ncbi:membrane hypothetical protein [Nostocoides japonicum T1-X7]|uniref:Uncharacterized protein n=1 Tax=Nostocoides japonicum T1-X7 TaxID=1194083 RepID=A0A077LYD2_9MICO|nr:hypothetical protein [Tetrasphaera japonica]CCH78656.1 membrane hypothetical protein [Tetrasphaera japonica T1-X7]
MARYVAALPESALPAWTSFGETPGDASDHSMTTRVTAPCSTLETLGLPCADGPISVRRPNAQLSQLVLGSSSDRDLVRVTVAEQPDLRALAKEGASFVVVSPTIDGLPLDRLQRTAYAMVPGGLQLETPGQGWVTAGQNVLLGGRWTVLLGSIGLAVVALAGTCALAGDVLASGAALTRLARLSARSRWVYALTLWRTAVPLTSAGLLAAGVYLVLPTGISHDTGVLGVPLFAPSPVLALTTSLAAMALAVCVSTWAARRLTRA